MDKGGTTEDELREILARLRRVSQGSTSSTGSRQSFVASDLVSPGTEKR